MYMYIYSGNPSFCHLSKHHCPICLRLTQIIVPYTHMFQWLVHKTQRYSKNMNCPFTAMAAFKFWGSRIKKETCCACWFLLLLWCLGARGVFFAWHTSPICMCVVAIYVYCKDCTATNKEASVVPSACGIHH